MNSDQTQGIEDIKRWTNSKEFSTTYGEAMEKALTSKRGPLFGKTNTTRALNLKGKISCIMSVAQVWGGTWQYFLGGVLLEVAYGLRSTMSRSESVK